MRRKNALIPFIFLVLPFSLTACELTVTNPDNGSDDGGDNGGGGGNDNGGGGGNNGGGGGGNNGGGGGGNNGGGGGGNNGGGGGGNNGGGGGGNGSGNSGSVSVNLSADPQSGTIPFEVTLRADARASDGGNLAYRWTVPDGEVRAGATYTVLVAEPGAQNFSVTASNGGDQATASVTVQASEPTLEPGNERPVLDNEVQVTPAEGTSPLEVTFAARASDPNSDTLDYIWDFGDGEITGGGATITHTYEEPSYYPVRVVVSDGRGGVDSADAEVFVNPPPATVNIDVTPDDASWEIYNYYWDDENEDYGYSYYESGTGDTTLEVPSYNYFDIYFYADGHQDGYDYSDYLEPGDTEYISITLEPIEDGGGEDGGGDDGGGGSGGADGIGAGY
jgi:hypothetical protein